MFSISSHGLARRVFSLVSLICLAILFARVPLHAEEKKPAPRPSPAQEESEALDKALQVSPNDPQALIKSLEDFLARFPESVRREQVLRTIYKQALQANDPRKAAATAEKLLELSPDDPDLLSAIVDLLDRQNDAASREKAIGYATRFIARAEKLAAGSRPPESVRPLGVTTRL